MAPSGPAPPGLGSSEPSNSQEQNDNALSALDALGGDDFDPSLLLQHLDGLGDSQKTSSSGSHSGESRKNSSDDRSPKTLLGLGRTNSSSSSEGKSPKNLLPWLSSKAVRVREEIWNPHLSNVMIKELEFINRMESTLMCRLTR